MIVEHCLCFLADPQQLIAFKVYLPEGRSATYVFKIASEIRPTAVRGYSGIPHCCVWSHLSLFMMNIMDLDPASLRPDPLKMIVGQTCNVIVPLA